MSVPEPPVSNSESSSWLSAAGSNIVTDLVGDPMTADLRLAMNGNQWMVLPELCQLWTTSRPDRSRVFYETLPPGIVVAQARHGRVAIGELSLSIIPDAVAAGPDMLAELVNDGLVDEPIEYARNDLAMLVSAAATDTVRTLVDLGRDHVRVAMPNPRTEGVGRLIVRALDAAGGAGLVKKVMETKLAAGTTTLTSIHHRESPIWLAVGQVDAAPLWSTEASYHACRRPDFRVVPIPEQVNQIGRYCVAAVRAGRPVGRDLVAFMTDPQVGALYARYGFTVAT